MCVFEYEYFPVLFTVFLCLYFKSFCCSICSGDFTLEGGPKSVFSTMADGMEMFLDVKETTLFRIFWSKTS